MSRLLAALLFGSAALALAGCDVDQTPANTTLVVHTPAQVATAPELAPAPPPPPHAELVPPPPAGPPQVWQPGHWRYTGDPANPWAWDNGGYVVAPPGDNTWVPGRWAQQPSGGWMWIAGHWA